MTDPIVARREEQVRQERRAKLAAWWWSLSDDERQKIRAGFRRRLETDPVFLSQVRKLIWAQRQ